MKYMLMTFGDQASMVEAKSTDWIREMIQFMTTLDDDLRKSGELIYEQGLADPGQAKTVSVVNGAPVAAAQPFAKSSQSLAGFWIVDVADEARAIAIASRIVAFTLGPIEVRRCMDAPPEA